MTRTEALLKLLRLGGLTYEQLMQTTGWKAIELHEVVAACKADGSIILKHRTRQGLAPIYEINPDKPEPKEAPKVQSMPSSEGNAGALEPVQPDVCVLRGSDDSANKTPTDNGDGEIKTVLCAACGLDSIRSRRGHAAGTCRHKNTCDSAVTI